MANGKGKSSNKLTPEQIEQQSLESSIKRIEENLMLISTPTYYFEVGDSVRIGHLLDVVVSKVLFEGKAYEITYSSVNNNYGNPITTTNQKNVVKWTDIRRKTNSEQIYKEDDLHLSYSHRSLEDIFGKVYTFGLNLSPDYQREHVWDLDDKVKLIDSIFNNIDIGKFVYVHLEWEDHELYGYEILDGKQRVTAIVEFFEDRFQYKGKYFSDLCDRDQSHFEDYGISYAEIRHVTLEQKLQYFLKLNTGGRIMDKSHLEKVQEMLNKEQMK